MLARLKPLADPMIAVLLIATALALVFPATGEARAQAQIVSNVAIFALFLVNGIRIARGEIARGLANWRFFGPLFLWVFGVMALAGWGLGAIASTMLPPLVALGFVYLGVLPSTIQSATDRPTPPPCENPAMTPQAWKKFFSPGVGPISGLPSGANTIGPLMIRLMPASARHGYRS